MQQPPWTLSTRLAGDDVEFCLGDGRRLAWWARRPAQLLQRAHRPMPLEDLLGDDLGGRLARSDPRHIHLQHAAALDGVAWEHLTLGGAPWVERFAVSRQLLLDTDSPTPAPIRLGETLDVQVLVAPGAAQGRRLAPAGAPRLAWSSLAVPATVQALQDAHVIVLEGFGLAELPQPIGPSPQERLLVVQGPQPLPALSGALDQGAAVLVLGLGGDPAQTLEAVLRLLGRGADLGEAVRLVHQRASPQPGELRVYGHGGMRFVSPPPPSSRRQVTSLSFDLVGSTALLREAGDEAYAELLARLHARCTDIVRRHGGQPDAPQGNDGVMCYFGHPVALEDAAGRAVRAGLEIARSVPDLGLSVRVGIATGAVAIMSGQPVGLTVHLAARLQQAAQPGSLLISDGTRRLVSRAFALQPLAQRPVMKGIEADEDAWRVVGPEPTGGQAPQATERLTPFVGRQEELERLHLTWRHVRVGECRLAVVRADAGVGKSRLVREFRHQLQAQGVKVLECRCRPDASASPFLSLVEAIRRWLDIEPDDMAHDPGMRRLASALPDGLRDAGTLALLGGLLGLDAQPPLPLAAGLRQRMLQLLVEWFRSFTGDRAGCLIIEDWHWVDPSMREFVERLARRGGGPGWLVVITSRQELTTGAPLLPVHDRIELTGLPPEAALELVSLACAQATLPAGLVRTLVSRGDGIPLFLEEAARMAVELGPARLTEDLAALEVVPASLQDLLTARLDALGPAKAVAQVAAVIGREFQRAPLQALLDAASTALDAATLDERLQALVASGLVHTEGDDHYAFKHQLVRDAAYASLWARDRRALHARMVELLQQRWPELASRRPELLAQHLTEAGMNREALAQWELAASSAAARSAEQEAISHVRRALSVLSRLDGWPERDRVALRLQLLLAARLLATEGYGAEAVLHAYQEAQRLCERMGDDTARFKVEMGLEAYRFMRGDFALALEHGRRAAAIAHRTGDVKQRLHAHWGLACTLFHQGDLRATMREMDAVLAAYSPTMHAQFGIQDPGVMSLAYSSWGLWEQGRPDSALARIEHAVALADEFGHKFSRAVALAYATSIELLRGETLPALQRAERCMQVCDEAGFPVWLAIARCMRGYLICERGSLDAGLAEMREGHALWLSTGAQVSQPLYLALQAQGLMLADRCGEAEVCVVQALEIVDRYGERQLEAELRRLRGELALRLGDRADAELWMKRAYVLAMRQYKPGFALRSATSLARLWAEDGRSARARRLLAPLLSRWSEGSQTRDLREAAVMVDSLS